MHFRLGVSQSEKLSLSTLLNDVFTRVSLLVPSLPNVLAGNKGLVFLFDLDEKNPTHQRVFIPWKCHGYCDEAEESRNITKRCLKAMAKLGVEPSLFQCRCPGTTELTSYAYLPLTREGHTTKEGCRSHSHMFIFLADINLHLIYLRRSHVALFSS